LLSGKTTATRKGGKFGHGQNGQEEGSIFSSLQDKKLLARLRCRLHHGGDPYLRLGPVKAETAHDAPEVTVFYDVVSPKEMEVIRKLAGPLVREYGRHL